ncbi:MAG: phosphatase PAP2 family protein [Clostridia bacterium]|nr:phosphatase PAP2 family protein [Clostridia bacterium]
MNNKKKGLNFLYASLGVLLFYIIYTICVKFIGVEISGESQTNVGFAKLNNAVFNFFGKSHKVLYNITDFGGLIPTFIACIFFVMGLVQLIKRKRLLSVDKNILILGLFYFAVAIVFFSFQIIKINYRPVLVNGNKEASYPSSTTVLSLTFMISAIYQIDKYIKNKKLNVGFKIASIIYSAFLVVVRVLCGYHWITDVIGGIIASVFLLLLYYALIYLFEDLDFSKKENK